MAMQAGHYAVTVQGHNTGDDEINLGSTEVGFDMIVQPALIPIRSDEYGRSVIDFLFAGMERMAVIIRSLHYSPTSMKEALKYMSGTLGTLKHTSGVLFQPLADLSRVTVTLRLYPTSGAAYSIGAFTSYEFEYAYPAERADFNFSSTKLFTIPFGFVILPDTTSGQEFFTMIATPDKATLPALLEV